MALRLFLFILLAVCAQASSPEKVVSTFSYTGDVGLGNSVFVVGNHPDVGNWDVKQAIKLRYTAGNVWTGEIAIQSGTQLQYRFIARATANGSWCDAANANYLTGNLSRSIPAQPAAPYHGKTLYYLSGWTTPNLFYNQNGSWISAPMTKIGAGRFPGESLFKINAVGDAGAQIEFVLTDGSGHYDNPPGGGNYLSDLDVFEVQDGNVFSYQPPAVVSPPQIVTHYVDSTATNIAGRNVRIYLPRGYTQNTSKRYPVLYLQDGQNVFDPGGDFGSWSADAAATREIGQGRMREAIMVGIDNTASRIPEYMPPNDSYQNTQGRGDAYANFVINNVRPYLDFNYRTLNDPKNTLTLGSSLGGLISLYLGREFGVFGKIGVFSPAFWISPNYISQVTSGSKKPIRVYLDFGTAEPSDDWNNALAMYDVHLAQGYAANAELAFVAGCGQSHNETAWAARLPKALQFLLPAREEPGDLTQREFPSAPVFTNLDTADRSAVFQFATLFGFTYTLERSVDLARWSAISSAPTEVLPWSSSTLADPSFPTGARFFWRLQVAPTP